MAKDYLLLMAGENTSLVEVDRLKVFRGDVSRLIRFLQASSFWFMLISNSLFEWSTWFFYSYKLVFLTYLRVLEILFL
jgi:hypothetical protein